MAISVGIVAGEYATDCLLWIGTTGAVASLILYILQKRRAAFAGVFLLIGLLTSLLHLPPAYSGGTNWIATGEVKVSPYSQRIVVRSQLDDRQRLLLYYHSSFPEIQPGDTLNFKGNVLLINDTALLSLPYYEYAFRNYVSGVVHISDKALTVSPAVGSVANKLWNWRRDFVESIESLPGLSQDAGAVLVAVLAGDSTDLDSAVRERFSQAGISHILALSGAHVAIIVLLVGWLLFPFRVGGNRRWVALVMIGLLWGYALLTGLSVSVLRAVIMMSIVLGGTLLRRPSSPLNNLFLASIMILIIDPRALWGLGFQLTFLATAGILLFVPLMQPECVSNPLLRALWLWVAVSVAATAATAPVVVYRLHIFPVMFVLGNILASAILPVFMGSGVFALFLNVCGLPVGWLCDCIDVVWEMLSEGCELIGRIPGATIEGGYCSIWWVAGAYTLLLLIWFSISRPRWK